MDERTALAVTAVRAVESADRGRDIWTDDDRAWASRAAAEVVGAAAPPEAFVARRALLAFERLTERRDPVARLARAWRWRPLAGVAIVVAALALGVASDWLGGARAINILHPPVLALALWNLAVYVALVAGYVVRYGEPGASGPLRRAVAWLAGAARAAPGASAVGGDAGVRALAAFAGDWSARAAPLYAARAARILHWAAAAFAAGAIAGLYVRGLVFEYRATWESTFLTASAVRAILAVAYAPGALVTGLAVPDVAAVAAIRAPASENAAPWLHLMAATLAVVVVVPRVVLAAATALIERHRAARVIDDLADPYFARLLRGFHAGTTAVAVLPYSCALAPEAAATLTTLLARALGGGVALRVAPAVAYGDEDSLPPLPDAAAHAPLVALFNATATPEHEAHGRFVATLHAAGRELVVVVDEAAFNARTRPDAQRRDERRALWRAALAEHDLAPVFVDLAQPDFDAAEAALDTALAEPLA